ADGDHGDVLYSNSTPDGLNSLASEDNSDFGWIVAWAEDTDVANQSQAAAEAFARVSAEKERPEVLHRIAERERLIRAQRSEKAEQLRGIADQLIAEGRDREAGEALQQLALIDPESIPRFSARQGLAADSSDQAEAHRKAESARQQRVADLLGESAKLR